MRVIYSGIHIVETGEKIKKVDKISNPSSECYSIWEYASISGNIERTTGNTYRNKK